MQERRRYYRLAERKNAIKIIHSMWTPPISRTPTYMANGRVSAETIIASFDVPPSPRSTVDGYAVVAEDTYDVTDIKGVSLKIGGSVKMGETPKITITRGVACRIETGGFLPPGANAVVPREYCVEKGDNVEIYYKVAPGQNVTARGWDIKKGEILVKEKEIITPQLVGLLAAAGVGEIKTFDIRAVLYSVGNELVPPGTPRPPGHIYDINSYTIRSLAKMAGIDIKFNGILQDEPEKIMKSILSGDTRIIIFSGGTSKGRMDPVTAVLEKLSPELLIRGLAMKPGKPTHIAVIDDRLVIGLPGNPTSAFMAFITVVLPILAPYGIRKLIQKKTAILGERCWGVDGRETFRTVKLKEETAYPVIGGSEEISTVARSDGFIVIPRGTKFIEKGTEVEVYTWRWKDEICSNSIL